MATNAKKSCQSHVSRLRETEVDSGKQNEVTRDNTRWQLCRRHRTEMGREDKLQLFNKCSVKLGAQFLHGIIDGICGRVSAQYPTFSEQWILNEWWDVVDATRDLIQEAAKENWSKEKLGESLEGLDGPHKQIIIDSYFARKEEIHQHLVKVTCNLSNAHLRDFDWQLKLVMSSDKLAAVNQPLLNLDLVINGDDGPRNVAVELTKTDLQKLIASMEAANKALLQLKT